MRGAKFSSSIHQGIVKSKTAGRLLALLVILAVICPASTYAGPDPVIELGYSLPEPMLEKANAEYYSVEMPDTGKFCDAVGLPLLPVKTAKILIPQGRDVKAINIAPGKKVILDGEFKIEYGTPSVPIGSNIVAEGKPDEKVYSSREPFPGNLYSVVSTQFLCGYKILILNLYPVQYIPALGKVSYYENMKVIVAHAPSVPSRIRRAGCRKLRQDRARVERLVDNPSETFAYTAELTLQEGTYEYVIITTSDMVGAFQTLADWKASRGFTTHIETIENITASYPGSDVQEQVRNFIYDAYSTWGTLYVVLGGDGDAPRAKRGGPIPCREVYGKAVGPTKTYVEDIPCDMYYGALDGNWDNDRDGTYGEGDQSVDERATGTAGDEADFFAEVLIGRIPSDNATEALNHIDKIIAYESSLHTTSALLVGRKLDEDPTYGGNGKDLVYAYFPLSWSATTLYDRNGTYSQTALISEMNSGAHHIVNYLSHSGTSNDMGLSSSQIGGLTNTKYFLAYSQGCNAGGFDSGTPPSNDCAGEHFTVENGVGGAFAYVGNTRYGWYMPSSWGPPSAGASQQFDVEFFDAVFNESIENIGKALQDSKEDLVGLTGAIGTMRWCYFELCLLGDPETPILEEPPVPPDTIPPAVVTNLATGDTTASSIVLTWTAPGDDGATDTASQYDIRYSTSAITSETEWESAAQCANEPLPLLAGTVQSFTVTGLSPSTTYYFALKTADEVPNWSEFSNSPSGTTEEGVGETIHVSAIDMSLKEAGPNVNAIATVTIVDASENAVSEATVYGHWSINPGDVEPPRTCSGVTGSDGKVTFNSDRLRNPPETIFTFIVDDVEKSGWTYDAGANLEDSDSITYSPLTAPSKTYATALKRAFPSPGNPDIWIPFTLSKVEHVVIRIYDASGRLVRTLELGEKAPGAYITKNRAAYWDGRNEGGEKAASGIYFYLMEAGSFRAMRKMVIAM
jgi:hypothetical protein